MMHRCLVESAWIDNWLKDQKTPLPAEAVRRFVEIVRVSSKEPIGVFDGNGRQITGILERSLKSCFLNQGVLFECKASSPQIILAQAALEESKMSETLKRGCEFGVDSFVIYAAHKSTPYCFAKLKKRCERLQSILADAARQSERLFVPKLNFADGLQSVIGPQGVFGDLSSSALLSQTLQEKFNSRADFLIVIGPEGGLSPAEIAFLQASKLTGVRFGPYTQRSELSGLAAVSIFNAFCQRA